MKKLLPIILLGLILSCKSYMEVEKPIYTQADKFNAGVNSIEINNLRVEEKAGDDWTYLGVVRNTFGSPFDLIIEESDLKTLFEEITASALLHGGNVISPDFKKKIVIDIKKLHVDGYVGYEVSADIDIKIVNEAGNVILKKPFTYSKGFTVWWGYEHKTEYNNMISAIGNEMAELFKTDEFKLIVK